MIDKVLDVFWSICRIEFIEGIGGGIKVKGH